LLTAQLAKTLFFSGAWNGDGVKQRGKEPKEVRSGKE